MHCPTQSSSEPLQAASSFFGGGLTMRSLSTRRLLAHEVCSFPSPGLGGFVFLGKINHCASHSFSSFAHFSITPAGFSTSVRWKTATNLIVFGFHFFFLPFSSTSGGFRRGVTTVCTTWA